MSLLARVCQPSILRMLICPEASNAQNNIAAVSADGSTVCVLIRRLNSSCSRSIALVVRALFHWLGGRSYAEFWVRCGPLLHQPPLPDPSGSIQGGPQCRWHQHQSLEASSLSRWATLRSALTRPPEFESRREPR